MQHAGQRLVNQEAERRVQQTFKQGKREVEGDQAGQQAVHAGVDGLVHTDDGLERQMIQNHIGRVDDEVVVRHGHNGHDQCAQPCADECAAAGLATLVHKAGDAHKQRPHDEIEQFTHRSSAGAGQLDEVFDQAHGDAGHRPVGVGGQQRGQLGHVQLDEGRHDGDRKLHVHKYGGDSAEHGGAGELADVGSLVLHEKMPPVKICESQLTNPGGSALLLQKQNTLPQNIRQGAKKQSKQLSVSFIRTLTVGPGITPGQQPHLQLVAGLRAMPLTAGGESHPALKQTFREVL